MTKEDKAIYNVIAQYKDDINNYKFDIVYDKLFETKYLKAVPTFTQMLLDININPLNYLNFVPKFYMYGFTIDSIEIPNNIKVIGHAAFAHCERLRKIKLSDTLTSIGSFAFSNCYLLKSVDFPKSLKDIYSAIFQHSGIANINYDGTLTQFENINIDYSNNDNFFYCTLTLANGKQYKFENVNNEIKFIEV